MKVRFVSSNKYKVQEARAILSGAGVDVVPVDYQINELQTVDTAALVRDKVLRAFDVIGRPLFVEHTGLFLSHVSDLPGGLTRVFWDRLQADRFAELFGSNDAGRSVAIAQTVIGFCDGCKVWQFDGEVRGHIVSEPRGPRGFQWDCVFVPDGSSKTFAEMGDEKNRISMRRVALDKFAQHLAGGR